MLGVVNRIDDGIDLLAARDSREVLIKVHGGNFITIPGLLQNVLVEIAELRDMAVDRSWIKTTVLFKMGQIGSDLGPFDRMEIFAGNRFFCPSDVFIEIGCIVCDGVGRQIPERKDVKMLLVEFSIVLIHRCRSS